MSGWKPFINQLPTLYYVWPEYFTGHFLTFTLQNVLSLNLHKLIKEWTTKYIREEM
ncbi:hypothetical protein [Chryseobacterium indologenes]|uniref:hypothetical protein n=1 Tax=Chryseobacterium indologenes TaxID=253 RepID=UPI001314927B|nr:hypothetical protein [Chryseobacterium indologenes]